MPYARFGVHRLYYEVDAFTDPWREPETICLLHGNGRSTAMWYAWVPRLAGEYRVVRLDALGHGRSSVPRRYRFSPAGGAHEVLAVLDHARLERVHLVGEATGGIVAIQAACDHPDRVASLTLISTPIRVRGERRALFARWDRMLATLSARDWYQANMDLRLDARGTGRARIAWLTNELGKTPRHVVKAVIHYEVTLDLTDRLPRVSAPTLIMAPTAGAIASKEDVDLAYKLIPRSEVYLIESRFHHILLTHPDHCTRALLRFLRR